MHARLPLEEFGFHNTGLYHLEGNTSPLRDPLIVGYEFSEQNISDLLAFLQALTNAEFLANPAHAAPVK